VEFPYLKSVSLCCCRWMRDFLRTGKPSQHITNTKVSSFFLL